MPKIFFLLATLIFYTSYYHVYGMHPSSCTTIEKKRVFLKQYAKEIAITAFNVGDWKTYLKCLSTILPPELCSIIAKFITPYASVKYTSEEFTEFWEKEPNNVENTIYTSDSSKQFRKQEPLNKRTRTISERPVDVEFAKKSKRHNIIPIKNPSTNQIIFRLPCISKSISEFIFFDKTEWPCHVPPPVDEKILATTIQWSNDGNNFLVKKPPINTIKHYLKDYLTNFKKEYTEYVQENMDTPRKTWYQTITQFPQPLKEAIQQLHGTIEEKKLTPKDLLLLFYTKKPDGQGVQLSLEKVKQNIYYLEYVEGINCSLLKKLKQLQFKG